MRDRERDLDVADGVDLDGDGVDLVCSDCSDPNQDKLDLTRSRRTVVVRGRTVVGVDLSSSEV